MPKCDYQPTPNINAETLPKERRMISVHDLQEALKYLDSQHPSFHNARLNTLHLEQEQKQPTFYVESQYFVLSKRTQNKNDSKFDLATR